jgi:hypothetical protein
MRFTISLSAQWLFFLFYSITLNLWILGPSVKAYGFFRIVASEILRKNLLPAKLKRLCFIFLLGFEFGWFKRIHLLFKLFHFSHKSMRQPNCSVQCLFCLVMSKFFYNAIFTSFLELWVVLFLNWWNFHFWWNRRSPLFDRCQCRISKIIVIFVINSIWILMQISVIIIAEKFVFHV